MAFHYTTAAKVRRIDAMLSSQDVDDNYEFSDTVIESVIDDHVQPVVDSMLGFTFTVPFTEDDTSGIIAKISADMAASLLISGDIAQFSGADPEKATRLWDKSMEFLQEIIDGKRNISFARLTNTPDVKYDTDPGTRPLNEIFAGDQSQWQEITETRGTS